MLSYSLAFFTPMWHMTVYARIRSVFADIGIGCTEWISAGNSQFMLNCNVHAVTNTKTLIVNMLDHKNQKKN